jgi:Zn-dependent protease
VINLIPPKPLDGYNAVVGLLRSGIGSEGAARRVLRRVALAWLPVELVGSAVLLVQRPFVGALVSVTIAAFFGQRIYVRHASA